MNPIELNQAIFEFCSEHNFPSDISKIFTLLRNNQDVLSAIKNRTNQYQNFDNDFLYDLISSIYWKNRKIFYPIFKYNVNDLIFDSNQPRLCLGLHSNFSPMTAFLLKKNLNFVVVSDFPQTIKKVAFSSGVRSGNIKIISRNETCLLNTKKFLQKNYLVSSTIDFKFKMPGPFNMLSDAMFMLAISIRPKTFFGINFVNNIGELTYITKDLKLDSGIEKMREDVLEFIANLKNNAKYQFGKFNYLEQNNLLNSIRSGGLMKRDTN
jgi:hypothetical protein